MGEESSFVSTIRSSFWDYLSTFFRTGKLPRWEDCRRTGTGVVLDPMPIPPFVPTRFYARYAF